MTGTLVKLGQNLAAALLGGPRIVWLPYLLLWVGTTAGATTYPYLGLNGLWIAAGMAAAIAGMARHVENAR